MTPVQGWTEHDYYRASRAARAAWQATSQQLALEGVLEASDVDCPFVASLEPASCRAHRDASPGGGGLIAGAEPHHGRTLQAGDQRNLPGSLLDIPVAVVAPARTGASAPSQTDGPDRMSTPGTRDPGQKGD